MSAALAAGVAAALVLGGLTASGVLLAAVLLVQALLVVGWFPALRASSPLGGRLVVGGTALAADVAVLAGDDTRPMAHVAAVLSLSLLAALAHQLVRRDGRGGLVGSLTATGAGAVLAGLASAWLALDVSRDGTGLLVLAAVAGAVPAVVDLGAEQLARRGAATPRWGAVVTGAVVTLLAALVVAAASPVGALTALAVAAGAAVAARLGTLLGDRAAAPHPALPAVLPAVLVAPAVYVLARVLVG